VYLDNASGARKRVSGDVTITCSDNAAGFSLVELLIVVMIIALIAAIAIPSFVTSQQVARETACIGYMKHWPQAQVLYYLQYHKFANTDQILVLDQFIGVGLGAGDSHQGYNFEIHALAGESESNMQAGWEGSGFPIVGGSEKRHFFMDQTGLIRFNKGSAAGRGSTPLGQN
jgi:prepilin-type N-terminal cleavage/methylation domain-containing protein